MRDIPISVTSLTLLLITSIGCSTRNSAFHREPPGLAEQVSELTEWYQANRQRTHPPITQDAHEGDDHGLGTSSELFSLFAKRNESSLSADLVNTQETRDHIIETIEAWRQGLSDMGKIVDDDHFSIRAAPSKVSRAFNPSHWKLKAKWRSPLREFGLPPSGKLNMEASFREASVKYVIPVEELGYLIELLNPFAMLEPYLSFLSF